MNKNQLVLPISILLGCIILGGFYYASETNKQASIERQQQVEQQALTNRNNADIQSKVNAQQVITDQNNIIANQKANCVKQAQQTAISEYNTSSYCTGDYPSNDCYKGTYLIPQYNSAYDICLQGKGLK